jgi:hypothetical protein
MVISDVQDRLCDSVTGMSFHDELVGVLETASQVSALESFLTRVLSDPVLAGVFLLHRDELFQRVTAIEDGVTIHLGTTGLPLLSHRTDLLGQSVERCAAKRAAYKYEEQTREAMRMGEQVAETASGNTLDAMSVAILNTVRDNPCLFDLVNGSERITRRTLRAKMRTYENLRVEESKNEWAEVADAIFAGRTGGAVRELFLHADLFHSAVDIDELRLKLLNRTIAHWKELLSARGVKEEAWRAALLALHQQGLVEHAVPLILWCKRCPETGVHASVSTSFVVHPV